MEHGTWNLYQTIIGRRNYFKSELLLSIVY